MDANIEELLRILEESKKFNEKEQISLLVEQMEEMNKNYAAVLRELETVKLQLKNYSHQAMPLSESRQRENLLLMTNEVGNKLAAQHNELQRDRRSLSEKAKQVVDNFKKIGASALNNVCDFLGIKERLVKYRDIARSNEMTMKASVEKIEKVESELNAAKNHAKNVFRAIRGKETLDTANIKESKFFNRLKAPYLKRQNKYAQRYEKLSRAIAKFDSLERAAHPINKYTNINPEKDDSKTGTLEKAASIEKADDLITLDTIKAGDMVKIHFYDTNKKEIETNVHDKAFQVYEKNGKLGIEWANGFSSLDTFASSVNFENIETGQIYFFNTITGKVENRHPEMKIKEKAVSLETPEEFYEEFPEAKTQDEEVNKPKYRAIYYNEDSEPVEIFSDTKNSAYQAVVKAKSNTDERDRCYIQKYDEVTKKYQNEGIYLIESGANVPPVYPHKNKKRKTKTTDKGIYNAKNRESVINKLSDNQKVLATRKRDDKQQEKTEKQRENIAR